jgi:hypothetical protein
MKKEITIEHGKLLLKQEKSINSKNEPDFTGFFASGRSKTLRKAMILLPSEKTIAETLKCPS